VTGVARACSSSTITVTLGSARLEVFVGCVFVCCIIRTQNIRSCLIFSDFDESSFSVAQLRAERYFAPARFKPLGTADVVYSTTLDTIIFRLGARHVAVNDYLALQGVLLASVGRVRECTVYKLVT